MWTLIRALRSTNRVSVGKSIRIKNQFVSKNKILFFEKFHFLELFHLSLQRCHIFRTQNNPRMGSIMIVKRFYSNTQDIFGIYQNVLIPLVE